MDKIEVLEKKIADMTEKYNLKYDNPESMANDLLDKAEEIIHHQAQLINFYKKQNVIKTMFDEGRQPSGEIIKLLQTNKEELVKWIERGAWHCKKVHELNEALKWIKKQYDDDFTERELDNLEPRDEAIYNMLKEKII